MITFLFEMLQNPSFRAPIFQVRMDLINFFCPFFRQPLRGNLCSAPSRLSCATVPYAESTLPRNTASLLVHWRHGTSLKVWFISGSALGIQQLQIPARQQLYAAFAMWKTCMIHYSTSKLSGMWFEMMFCPYVHYNSWLSETYFCSFCVLLVYKVN